jgi:hypothetical protein
MVTWLRDCGVSRLAAVGERAGYIEAKSRKYASNENAKFFQDGEQRA